MDDYKFWWDVGHSLVTAVVVLVIWLRRPGEDAIKQLASLKAAIDRELAEIRVAQGELRMKIDELPDTREVLTLTGDVRVIKQQVEGLSNTQQMQTAALARIEQFLLQSTR